MGLNCKPDDLAVIVRTHASKGDLLGRIVRVKELREEITAGMGPTWTYEPQLVATDGRKIFRVNDCALRPIRDPGDDAVDETLINNPVRHEVTA